MSLNQVAPPAGPGRGTTPNPSAGGPVGTNSLSGVVRTLSNERHASEYFASSQRASLIFNPVVKANGMKERANKEKAPSSASRP